MKLPNYKFSLSVAGAVLIAALLSACDSGPARLDSVKLGKTEAVDSEAAGFGTKETVYAKAKIGGSADKVTVKWQAFVDQAEGLPDNTHLEGADASIDLSGGQNISTYHLSPTDAGWAKGKYHLDVRMFVGGEQKAQQTAAFTVN